jgi:2'-5' RNA ligase
MAFLGLSVPAPTARVLSEIDFGDFGEKEPPSSMHITVLYVGKEVAIETIASMIPVIFSVAFQTKPFTVATSRVTTFPPNPDDGVPIIAPIESNDLLAFRKVLCAAFDEAKIEYNKKYPDYRPHVTLGYSQDPLVNADNAVDLTIPIIEWGAHELVLWGGDSGDNRLIVTFPLSVVTTKTSMHKAFVQLAKNWSTIIPEF